MKKITAQAIIYCTGEDSNLTIRNFGELILLNKYTYQEVNINQHIHIVDYYNVDDDNVVCKRWNGMKIIATTKKSLKLPIITKDFLKEYIKEYNKNPRLIDVIVSFDIHGKPFKYEIAKKTNWNVDELPIDAMLNIIGLVDNQKIFSKDVVDQAKVIKTWIDKNINFNNVLGDMCKKCSGDGWIYQSKNGQDGLTKDCPKCGGFGVIK